MTTLFSFFCASLMVSSALIGGGPPLAEEDRICQLLRHHGCAVTPPSGWQSSIGGEYTFERWMTAQELKASKHKIDVSLFKEAYRDHAKFWEAVAPIELPIDTNNVTVHEDKLNSGETFLWIETVVNRPHGRSAPGDKLAFGTVVIDDRVYGLLAIVPAADTEELTPQFLATFRTMVFKDEDCPSR